MLASLPTAKIANTDISRIINSTEVQSVVRTAGAARVKRPYTQKKNPLKNQAVLFRLNPYAKAYKAQEKANIEKKTKAAEAERKEKKLSAGEAFKSNLLAP